MFAYKINQNFLITLYTTFAIAFFITPLQYSTGYFIILSSFLCFFTTKISIEEIDKVYIILLVFSFIVYNLLMYPQFEGNYIAYRNNSIIMLSTGILVTFFRNDVIARKSKKKSGYYDYLFFILLAYVIYCLIRFTLTYLGNWGERMYAKGALPFGCNHVDFSIIVILCFILGIRREHYILSSLLVLFSWLILPSRTSRLFFILFLFFVIFFKIKEFKKMTLLVLPKSIFSFCILVLVLCMFFALFFVLVLPKFMELKDTHSGLYDTSNKDRFTGFLYSLQIIWDKKLFLKGILPSSKYSTLIPSSSYATEVPPHNSFLSLILYNSIFFGGLYLLCITRWMQNKYTQTVKDGCILLSYIVTSLILHDMLIGPRFFAFFCFMSIPVRETEKKFRHFSF